jgi:hypothetical protein
MGTACAREFEPECDPAADPAQREPAEGVER